MQSEIILAFIGYNFDDYDLQLDEIPKFNVSES